VLLSSQVGKPQRPAHHFDDMNHAFLTIFTIISNHVLSSQVGKPQRPAHHFDDMYHAFLAIFTIISNHVLLSSQVGKPQRPAHHFDDMYHAFITVFIIITMDDWTDIMFPLQKVCNAAHTVSLFSSSTARSIGSELHLDKTKD